MTPLVSILIRTLNREKLLLEALLSIASQHYRPIEVIIINDGGRPIDELLSKEQPKFNSINIHNYNHSHCLGRSHAANTAMEKASGEFLLFLDDDDLIEKTHIENLMALLLKQAEHQNIIGAYSGTQCVKTENGELIATEGLYNEEFDPIKLSYSNYLPIHAVLFKKSAYDLGCRFNTQLELYEDWNFWLQVIQHGALLHEPQITALYRIDESGIGQPNQVLNKDTTSHWNLFIKESRPFFSEAQLNHLIFSARTFSKLQSKLENQTLANDELEREIKILQKNLEDWEQTHNAILSHLDNKKETVAEQKLEIQRKNRLIDTLTEENSKNRTDYLALTKQLNIVENQNLELTTQLAFIKDKSLIKLAKDKSSSILRTALYALKYIIKQTEQTIMKIYPYIQAFLALILKGQFHQAYQRTRGFLKRFYLKKRLKEAHLKRKEDTTYILATHHTQYVAEMVKEALHAIGKSEVLILPPETENFAEGLHFVICPQMFEKLPGLYIAFQMEQSVSSRWFNKDYFQTLENAMAVMDYSKTNIRFLQETGKLHYKQVFWTPISNVNEFRSEINTDRKPKYDVAFYGDPNNERRQAFLSSLKQDFSVLVVSEVFGDALYKELSKARLIVNIHYYENALLETTRLYECLSLGFNVVSESSSDQIEHSVLAPYVNFTPIGDIEAMKTAIKSELMGSTSRNKQIPNDLTNFQYYFARMMVAIDLLPALPQKMLFKYLSKDDLKKPVTLTLPETFERHSYIKEVFPENTTFSGLRHFEGWVGAATSFKYLALASKHYNIKHLQISEDDVELKPNFKENYQCIQKFLFEKLKNEEWDIFCGLIADLNDDAKINKVYEYQGITLIELDKMTSMVFNIYNQKAIDLISNWDDSNRDIDNNTIDRYLESNKLKVITTLPYLVSHLPDHTSSIWHFENSIYDDLIEKSEAKLQQKLDAYLIDHQVINLN